VPEVKIAIESDLYNRECPATSFTAHALLRLSQRNLSPDDIEYVVAYGLQLRRAGAVFSVLRHRDIPGEDRRVARYARLESTVVVQAADSEHPLVLTAYRSDRAYRRVKRKASYGRERRKGRWTPWAPFRSAAMEVERLPLHEPSEPVGA
jgi:hypothetical protein